MLGRVRRTTPTDVSLALVMAGLVYLAWALACWCAKETAAGLSDLGTDGLPPLSKAIAYTFGGWERSIFDVAGPLWMLASLYMIIRASRQRRIISWSWLLISCQAIAAILIGVWTSMGQLLLQVHFAQEDHQGGPGTWAIRADWSPYIIGIAVLIWVGTLIWLVAERVRLRYLLGGPAIRDGVKTHSYRR